MGDFACRGQGRVRKTQGEQQSLVGQELQVRATEQTFEHVARKLDFTGTRDANGWTKIAVEIEFCRRDFFSVLRDDPVSGDAAEITQRLCLEGHGLTCSRRQRSRRPQGLWRRLKSSVPVCPTSPER